MAGEVVQSCAPWAERWGKGAELGCGRVLRAADSRWSVTHVSRTDMPLAFDLSQAPTLAAVEARILQLLTQVGAEDKVARAVTTVSAARPFHSKFELHRGHGLYLFVIEGRVAYVGRAIGPTLGQRVRDQVRHLGDPAWDNVLDFESTQIHLWQISGTDAIWAASIEAFICSEFRVPINKRLS